MNKSAQYLAGLIDGDGSILIVRRDRKRATTGDRYRGISFEIVVKIGGETNHLNVLRELWDDIGYIWTRKRKGQRHLSEWIISGNNARYLLPKINKHLILKVKQGYNALSFPQCKSRWDATPKFRKEQTRRWKLQKQLNSRVGRGKRGSIWQ